MRFALHAEWTKLRTVTGPPWLTAGTIVATVALSAAATSVVTCEPDDCGGDMVKLSLIGVDLGQALVAILAVLVISGEFSTGMIRTTLTAMPRRLVVFAAKALLLAAVVAVAGTVAVLGSLLAGRLVRPGHGDQTLTLTDGPTLRAVTGSILYLVLIALLSLGIATALRDSATSIGIVLGLLYILPILAQTIGDPEWRNRFEKIAPMSAGLRVTAAWAAAALLIGGLLLRRRDA
ncbi:MAG: ABC transporter permease [Spirillospora sp.]